MNDASLGGMCRDGKLAAMVKESKCSAWGTRRGPQLLLGSRIVSGLTSHMQETVKDKNGKLEERGRVLSQAQFDQAARKTASQKRAAKKKAKEPEPAPAAADDDSDGGGDDDLAMARRLQAQFEAEDGGEGAGAAGELTSDTTDQ